MNVLIVYAHPEPRSMNGAMMKVLRERFARHGHEVVVADLYAGSLHAVPSRADFTQLSNPARFSLVHEQRHAHGRRGYRADILQGQDAVAAADLIVFQFPLWWYGVPAIVKGWAERVLAHGFAYDDAHLFEHGLLKGKRAMLSFTTGATRAELDADSHLTGTVEQFLQPFAGGVLGFCGMDVLAPFVAYGVGRMDDGGRRAVLDRLGERIDAIAGSAGAGPRLTLPILQPERNPT